MKPEIKAFVFDAYGTLFDVHSVTKACDDFFPDKGEAISQGWRKKQLEYFFLRQVMGRYAPFDQVTLDALRYAVKEQQEELSHEQELALLDAYKKLDSYNEVKEVLSALQGRKLVVFSNGSPNMLEPLVEQSGFSSYLTDTLSVDKIKQFKPSPASYNQVLEELNVRREEVLFMSSNGWDISGAKSFGFHTAWINRNELPQEELGLTPDCVYTDLKGIVEWL
ncbi:haloacid dehalogenase type II [Jeotgalibacillus proteolyticus]|uniref:haloacid dehalogenase type II n=1 Tax=Jeotgalibacillus proteolyticus TaxID=2082395 RepID=UPI003CEF1828